MRKIIVATFTSLDGVMQAPGGPREDPTGGFALGGWTAPHFDEALGASMGEIFGRPFDLLLGRKTYDIFAAHWPYVRDPNDPIAGLFNQVTARPRGSRTFRCAQPSGRNIMKAAAVTSSAGALNTMPRIGKQDASITLSIQWCRAPVANVSASAL